MGIQPAMIQVLVAEAAPLTSESLAQALSEDPSLVARAVRGSAKETFERCRACPPCVLLAAESLLKSLDPYLLREQIDYGRAIRVVVLGSDTDGGDAVAAWLHLGCSGYVSRSEGLEILKKVVRAVASGEIWAKRTLLTQVIRHLLSSPAAGLTPRERQVLELIAAGATNREISKHLFISDETVRWHVRRLFAKTGVHDRAEAVAFARRHGLGLAPAGCEPNFQSP